MTKHASSLYIKNKSHKIFPTNRSPKIKIYMQHFAKLQDPQISSVSILLRVFGINNLPIGIMHKT
jgi:hypothetical protein